MSKIHVFPRWRSNPYLNMLYVGARAEGWSVQGSRKVADLAEALTSLGAGDVLHIHWTHPITQSKTTWENARKSLDTFKGSVVAATGRGVRLVWTVHNQIPHSTKYPDLEIELAQFLAAECWRVIQLNRSTRSAVAEFYDLPAEKLVTLPHASYNGIYGPGPDQAEARASLGIPLTAPAIAFVGQVQPYKGIGTLLEAAGRLAPDLPELTVLLAGRTDPEELVALDRAIPAGVRMVRHHEFVPDAKLGTWFAAADVMVFPYQRVLNSGSLMASATFERPAILPAEPHLLDEYGDQEWVRFYKPGSDPVAALAETIAQTLPRAAELRQAAAEFAASYTTYDMAWDYVRLLDGDSPAVEPAAPPAEATDAPEVSVVIPTHNIEPYLDELLRSVRASAEVQLEIVIVDDSSSDGTWQLAARHADADPRIRLVASPGRGSGQARNYGVELARGEYLAFADGDDLVPPRAYATMLDAARRGDADLVVGNFVKFTTVSTWQSDRRFGYTTAEDGITLADHPGLIMHRPCWNRLARREFWQQEVLPFSGVPRTNDIVTLTSALTAARRISVVPQISYIYRIRPGKGSMLSGVGTTSATISYLSEEVTCARLVGQAADPGISAAYWEIVLGDDTWNHLQRYLQRSDLASGAHGPVLDWYARLIDLAPQDALDRLRPELRSFHELVRAGRLAEAAQVTLPEPQPVTPPVKRRLWGLPRARAKRLLRRLRRRK